MAQSKKSQLVEFKGNTLSVIVVTLRSLHPKEIAKVAEELLGGDTFFEGDAALLELSQLGEFQDSASREMPDWAALVRIFAHHGLRVIGVRGANDALREDAMLAGLPNFPAAERTAHQQTPALSPQDVEVSAALAPEVAPPVVAELSPPRPSASVPTLVVDRPLRSGQQVYARGGDLVVLAAVSSGAEVIADGSIHVYAPLRGRALAGASGALDARIFTTRFEAELVSIAGVYRTFESDVPDNLAGQPVQIHLSKTADNDKNKLLIVSLKTN